MLVTKLLRVRPHYILHIVFLQAGSPFPRYGLVTFVLCNYVMTESVVQTIFNTEFEGVYLKEYNSDKNYLVAGKPGVCVW